MAFAPETHLIAAPVPTFARPRRPRRSRSALDRAVITLGLVQGASDLFDGATTRYFLHHCSTCTEVDPVSHFLLGSRPTWTGMIAAGSVEALAATYLAQSMRHSRHKFVRQCAPLVPLLLTGIHVVEGSRNLSQRNEFYCTTPG
jgi:acyl-CoA thioesterase